MVFTGIWLIFWLAFAVLWFVAWVQIFNKAGYTGWLTLLFLIPVVNIILFLWFAFSEWPALKRAGRE